MTQEGITQIDIRQVLQQKAPSAARKIPGFVVNYLIRTVHQDELNDILRRYHDKDGVAFMQELIGYFDLNLELVNEGISLKKGVTSSLRTIRWAGWTVFASRRSSANALTGRSATW